MEKNMGGHKYTSVYQFCVGDAAAADEQLEVVTNNSEEVGGGSTATAGSNSTAEFIDLQDAASLQREFAVLFRCSKRMRLAADDNEIDIYSIPQVLDQSSTEFIDLQDAASLQREFAGLFRCSKRMRLAADDNEIDIYSIPQVLDQSSTEFIDLRDAASLQREFASLFRCSKRMKLAADDNEIDIYSIPQVLDQSATGASNSVISGSHNVILHDSSEVDTGSVVDQDSYVQETNLGNSTNECHSLELQNSVEGSDYQWRGNRDNATSSQYTADESFRTSYILPAQPFSCDPMERWKGHEREVQKEKAALSEEIIMKRLVTRDCVPRTATNDSEASSALDCREQGCSICLAGYENHDKVGVLYYCECEFHADCLKTWLLKQNTCPICRVPALIPAHLPDYDDDVDVHRAFFLPVYKAVKFLPGLLS